MMNEQCYYSFSAKGFFWLSEDELKSKNIPADLKPFSEEKHAALFLGQEHGKYISHTPEGPILVDMPDYTPEELIMQTERKKTGLMQAANDAIAPLQDAVDLDMASDEEKTVLMKWKKYRVLLNRVNLENAPDIIWPDIPA